MLTAMDEPDVKEVITQRVRQIADDLDWMHLTIAQRTRHYKEWTEDPEIGGLLSQIMDPSKVRVFLKDTVMGRQYTQPRRPQLEQLLSTMGVSCQQITREFIKPQALLCGGRRLYTITVAKEWEHAILSAFERGCEVRQLISSVVFVTEHTTGRFVDKAYRDLIDEAARRLGVKVEWIT